MTHYIQVQNPDRHFRLSEKLPSIIHYLKDLEDIKGTFLTPLKYFSRYISFRVGVTFTQKEFTSKLKISKYIPNHYANNKFSVLFFNMNAFDYERVKANVRLHTISPRKHLSCDATFNILAFVNISSPVYSKLFHKLY